MSIRIALEGNISAGKSTVLRGIAEAIPAIAVHPEPVHEWSEALSLLYKDPHRYSFLMNCRALASMADPTRHDADPKGPGAVVVTERSVDSVVRVFAKVQSAAHMNKAEAKTLRDMHRIVAGALSPDATIYVRTDPDACFARMQGRGRPEETEMTFPYLNEVHRAHEEWMYGDDPPRNLCVVEAEGRSPEEVVQMCLGAIAKISMTM
jgi:deoxyadenosine/deoxycytidine kinase